MAKGDQIRIPKRSRKTSRVIKAASGKAGEPKQRLNVDLPQSLHRKLKAHAAANGEKVTDIVIRLVKDHLRK